MSCQAWLRPVLHFNRPKPVAVAPAHLFLLPSRLQPPRLTASPLTRTVTGSAFSTMTSITLPHNVDPSPLFLPPDLVPNPATITRLAVYGTLRDDDDSGHSWTSSFIANRTSACSGIVRGAKLYWAHKLGYPTALVTNNTNDHIHVRVMTFGAGDVWVRKLAEADSIEGYDAEAEGRSEYVRRRVVVEVGCEGSGLNVEAWIYVATKLDHFGQVVELPHGDWSRRTETDQWKKNDDTQ